MSRFQQGSSSTTSPNTTTTTAPVTKPVTTAPCDAAGVPHVGGPGGHGLPHLGEVFTFTIASGAVTAAGLTLPSGSKVSLPLTTGVTYSVSGSDVLATRTNAMATDVLRYSDADADGLYAVTAQSHVLTTAPTVNALGFPMREALSVTLSGTQVTAVSQTRWDGTEKVLLSATVVPTATTWAINNGLLVQTHTTPNGQAQWEVFRDGNADGVYTEVASGNGTLIDLVGVVSQTDAFAAQL